MPVRVYLSTDASAPVLSNSGSMPSFFKALLVDGYPGKAAAGWTLAFSSGGGYDRRVFRQGGGPRAYFEVGQSTAGDKTDFVGGWESMTDVSTGNGNFGALGSPFFFYKPTELSGPHANHLNLLPSIVAAPWIVVADERTVFAAVDKAGLGIYTGVYFGEIFSRFGAVAGRNVILNTTTMNGNNENLSWGSAQYNPDWNQAGAGLHKMQRSPLTGDLNVTVGAIGIPHASARNYSAAFSDLTTGRYPYPHPVTGKTHVARIQLHEALARFPIGHLRGLWATMHDTGLWADGDTFSGDLGDGQTRTWRIVRHAANPETDDDGAWVVETSSTWDTNA